MFVDNNDLSAGVHVLFSAHGVPQSYIEAGDPYQRQIEVRHGLADNELFHVDSMHNLCFNTLTTLLYDMTYSGTIGRCCCRNACD